MIRTRNHRLPKPDDRGRVRPHVGVRFDGSKARIDVGNIKTDGTTEMERRLLLIRRLYEKLNERTVAMQRREGMPEQASWTKWALLIAKRIGRGEPITEDFIADQFSSDVESADYTSTTTAGVIAQLRSWGIPVVDSNHFNQGLLNNREQIEAIVAETVQRKLAELQSQRGAIVNDVVLPDPLTLAETATFHDAIDAFKKYLKDTGKKNAEGKLTNTVYTKIDLAKSFKTRYEDFPLRQLTLPKWEELITYWRNRP